MVKRRRLIDDDDDDKGIIVEELDDNSLPPDIQALTEELGSGNFTVAVQKYADNGSIEKIGTFPASEFNADAVAKEFGGGRFKFTIRNEQGKYVKQVAVTYAKPAVVKPAEIQADSSSKVVSILEKQVDALKEETKSVNAAMFAMITKVMEMQMTQARVPQGSSLDELVKLVTVLGLNKNPSENVSSVMGLIKDGIDMGRKISEASGDVNPENILLMKLMEQISPLLSKLKGAPQAGLTGIPEIPAAPPARKPALEIVEETKMLYTGETERAVIEILKESAPALVSCAKMNADTSMVINMIDTKLNDEGVSALLDYYALPDSFLRTLEFIPQFKTYKPWFEKLLSDLTAYYNEPETTEENIQ